MSDTFKAYFLEQDGDAVTGAVKELTTDQLPDGDVTVAVDYSTINYKDGMVVNGLGNLVRTYPHIPGIDFAGTVEASDNPDYKPGDKVVLTGWRVGEMHWGGLSQKARVKGDWLVKLPDGLSAHDAMAVGTAGFTAMLCINALERQGLSKDKPVLVTGASGGVGSVAISILANLGYDVAAVTGRPEGADYLNSLGATEVVTRAEMEEKPRPLDKERWAGVVDTVAGPVLAKALSQIAYGGSAACCGLASGPKLETTVIPFLLRGVNILGIDSVMQPKAEREAAWKRIATELPMASLKAMTHDHPLGEVKAVADQILKGQVQGRAVIDVNA